MPSINADFSLKVVQYTTKMPFVASPNPQVKRIMLDRVGDEVARATSIVRYEPGSTFERHMHGGGEEILVFRRHIER
jgi:anti-ECFsigma factor, ChrR